MNENIDLNLSMRLNIFYFILFIIESLISFMFVCPMGFIIIKAFALDNLLFHIITIFLCSVLYGFIVYKLFVINVWNLYKYNEYAIKMKKEKTMIEVKVD